MANKTLEELIEGYLGNNLTKEELAHFIQLIKEDEVRSQLKQRIDKLLSSSTLSVPAKEDRMDTVFRNIIDAGKAEAEDQADQVFQLKRRSGFIVRRRVAAAAIVILVAAGAWLYLNGRTGRDVATKPAITAPAAKNTIVPGSNKATLLLADGSVLALDDEKNGELTRQGGSKVIKVNGKLAYDASTPNSKEALFNTISTPRGGQYQVELADGTLVWLNAASSLHFPTAFTGKERKVEITGEAYFEVARNKDKPFIVVANGTEVKVLGTHFNVMAYDDERELATTLLEGSVQVVSGSATSKLEPGQQSRLSKSGRLRLVKDVDVNAVVAWKNGLFHFENADIETVMKQLSRWYDVDLVFQENFQNRKMSDPLYVEIPRNTTLRDVLKALELAGGAKFEIEGKKVYVK